MFHDADRRAPSGSVNFFAAPSEPQSPIAEGSEPVRDYCYFGLGHE
jgi:hypothetical protein